MAEIVSLRLTADQVAHLTAILARQRGRGHGALMAVASVSYEPLDGCSGAKLDVAWIPWKVAQKVCRLIRES